MAKEKVTVVKTKKIKDQFVLIIGDEGAILTHYNDGKLENRLFAESPAAVDIGLIEKLLATYSKSPISILVDVIEQNYSQQTLPPVSPLTVKQQVLKKIKRDFQPKDFNGYIPMGRSAEGRKDWNFLFISLANVPPFSDWLAFVMAQPNDFNGVYLLPIEAQGVSAELSRAIGNKKQSEWEIVIFHNKTSGFRITAFKKGKIIFTRLAQQLIGENIPEVVVGALEQEVQNTIEYLKRLGYRGETDSKLTLIAGQDIIEKIDKKSWHLGVIDLYSPLDAAKLLGLTQSVNEKDKYADIICSAFFASRKPILPFDSSETKTVSIFYQTIKVFYVIAGIIALIILSLSAKEAVRIFDLFNKASDSQMQKRLASISLNKYKGAEKLLPANYKRQIDIMQITENFPKQKDAVEQAILKVGSEIIDYKPADGKLVNFYIKGINYSREKDNGSGNLRDAKFKMEIEVEMEILSSEQDFAAERVAKFESAMTDILKEQKYTLKITQPPLPQASKEAQKITVEESIDPNEKVKFAGTLEISGNVYQEENPSANFVRPSETGAR